MPFCSTYFLLSDVGSPVPVPPLALNADDMNLEGSNGDTPTTVPVNGDNSLIVGASSSVQQTSTTDVTNQTPAAVEMSDNHVDVTSNISADATNSDSDGADGADGADMEDELASRGSNVLSLLCTYDYRHGYRTIVTDIVPLSQTLYHRHRYRSIVTDIVPL